MVEGEGYIGLIRRRGGQPCVRINVTNTEVETIATCLRLVGAGFVGYRPGYPDKRNGHVCRDRWDWHLAANNDILELLKRLIPYLTGKKERARRAVQYLEAANA